MQRTSITHDGFVVSTFDLDTFEYLVYMYKKEIYQPHNQTATLGPCKCESIKKHIRIPIVHISCMH